MKIVSILAKAVEKKMKRLYRAVILCLGVISGLVFGLAGFGSVYAAGPGPEVCKNCHAAQVESYQATKHGTKADARTPAGAGACSTCHGDGTAHVNAGGGETSGAPATAP